MVTHSRKNIRVDQQRRIKLRMKQLITLVLNELCFAER